MCLYLVLLGQGRHADQWPFLEKPLSLVNRPSAHKCSTSSVKLQAPYSFQKAAILGLRTAVSRCDLLTTLKASGLGSSTSNKAFGMPTGAWVWSCLLHESDLISCCEKVLCIAAGVWRPSDVLESDEFCPSGGLQTSELALPTVSTQASLMMASKLAASGATDHEICIASNIV